MAEQLIHLDDTLLLGVAELDRDHQKLVEVTNFLLGALLDPRASPMSRDRALHDLYTFSEHHFRREERLMSAHNYPGTVEHRAVHRQLLTRFRELDQQFADGQTPSEAMGRFIRNWLVEHIQRNDMNFVGFLRKQGILDA
ncbi:MAG: bacteriohemerythrin [Magnetococcales bacterium]|nr:bacteriohemerythrin [Magnetococcales bacterium]